MAELSVDNAWCLNPPEVASPPHLKTSIYVLRMSFNSPNLQFAFSLSLSPSCGRVSFLVHIEVS